MNLRPGALRLVGEAGPEAIIPLGRGFKSGGRGGGDLHIHIEGPVFGDDRAVNDLALKIRDKLVRSGFRNGGGMFGGQG